MNDKKAQRAQIKKDKARLKELKRKDKSGQLTEDEVREYIRLLNENSARVDKLTEKLNIVTFVILGLTTILVVVKIVLMFALC